MRNYLLTITKLCKSVCDGEENILYWLFW